jgi:hypothetical protein
MRGCDIIDELTIRKVFMDIYGKNLIFLAGTDKLLMYVQEYKTFRCEEQNSNTIVFSPEKMPIYTYKHDNRSVSLIRLTGYYTVFSLTCHISHADVIISSGMFIKLDALMDKIKNPIKKDLGLEDNI